MASTQKKTTGAGGGRGRGSGSGAPKTGGKRAAARSGAKTG